MRNNFIFLVVLKAVFFFGCVEKKAEPIEEIFKNEATQCYRVVTRSDSRHYLKVTREKGVLKTPISEFLEISLNYMDTMDTDYRHLVEIYFVKECEIFSKRNLYSNLDKVYDVTFLAIFFDGSTKCGEKICLENIHFGINGKLYSYDNSYKIGKLFNLKDIPNQKLEDFIKIHFGIKDVNYKDLHR